MDIFINLIKEIWHTFDEAAFYILFGLVLAGLIHAMIKKDQIGEHFGPRKFKSVLKAALFGVPLPLCSCGVIPTAISLRKSGASKGATLSFLISTPESGIDSIALSYALLDPIMTIFRPIAAFVTALVAGVGENIFGGKDEKEAPLEEKPCGSCGGDKPSNPARHLSFKEKLKSGMNFAFNDLLGDIAKWFMLGIIIAGIISFFVPDTFIVEHLSSGWQAYVFILLAGIPLYVCASASTPIAAAMILKGMSPGVALVFLLVGPATNVATILVIGKILGRRAVAIYLISIAFCAVALGLLLNYIYMINDISVMANLGKAGEMMPHPLKTLSSVLLIIFMVLAMRRTKRSP